MLNNNIIFVLDNWLDEAGTVLYAGSQEANMPVSNLQDEILAVQYRSAAADNNDVSKTYIDVTFAQEKEFDITFFSNHEMSRVSTFTQLVSSQAAWGGLSLSAGVLTGVSTLPITASGQANIRIGDRFTMAGDSTQYKVTAVMGFGENLVPDGEAIGSWTLSALTVTANSKFGCFVNSKDDRLVEGATTAEHKATKAISISNSASYIMKVYAQKGERTRLRVGLDDGSSNGFYADFNLDAATVGSVVNTGSGAGVSCSIAHVSGDTYLCTIKGSCGGSGTGVNATIKLLNSLGAVSYTGDITKGLYVGGVQLIAGTTDKNYAPTTTGSATGSSGNISISPALASDKLSGVVLTCLTGDFTNPANISYNSEAVYPTGIPFRNRAYDSLFLRWENSEFWFGQLSDAESAAFYQNAYLISDDVLYAKYIRILIDNSVSTQAFFDIGRLFIGGSVQLPYNAVFGSAESAIDNTPRMMTLGGVTIKDRRPRVRTANYVIDEVPHAPINYRPLFKQIQNRIGKSKQVVVIPIPNDIIETSFNAMICTQGEISDLVYKTPNTSSTKITLVEEK